MKVRFLVPYGPYAAGQVIEEYDHPGAADLLTRRGILEIVVETPPLAQVETMVPQQTVAINVNPPKKGRRWNGKGSDPDFS